MGKSLSGGFWIVSGLNFLLYNITFYYGETLEKGMSTCSILDWVGIGTVVVLLHLALNGTGIQWDIGKIDLYME